MKVFVVLFAKKFRLKGQFFIVKVLKFDSQSNSYTIEYEGQVINTVEKFLDKNVSW